MSDRLRFHNPEIPDPIFLNEVPLKNGMGQFPHLQGKLLHGFWWQEVENISYMQEPGYLSELTYAQIIAMVKVNARLRHFLKALEMAPLENGVVLGAYPGATEIVDLNQTLLDKPRETDHVAKYFQGGAIFTTLPRIPAYTIGGDCTWAFIYCERPDQPPVAGMAHSGRREIEQFFPKTVISHLVNNYGCKPENMVIGIIPSLEPEHHTIQAKDLKECVKAPWRWVPHYMKQLIDQGPLHLDVRSWVADQFIESGVRPEKIVLSTVGTYQSQALGFGISHRFATVNGLKDGRMAVGFQLPYQKTT